MPQVPETLPRKKEMPQLQVLQDLQLFQQNLSHQQRFFQQLLFHQQQLFQQLLCMMMPRRS